jgi:predicted site-specific integrase-resolvase
MGDFIAAPEAARILGVDTRTVQRQAARGELPVLSKLSGRTGAYLFHRSTIEAVALERAA